MGVIIVHGIGSMSHEPLRDVFRQPLLDLQSVFDCLPEIVEGPFERYLRQFDQLRL
jgi:hypothetical protein